MARQGERTKRARSTCGFASLVLSGLGFLWQTFSFAVPRVFSDKDYSEMRDDSPRTSAFFAAIDSLAPGRTVLDLGTGALALLALRCAEAGAKHVYAVEAQPEAAAKARLAVDAAGAAKHITVLQGNSVELSLPERVDLVVHEVIGEIGSREGLAKSLRDAVQRHVKPEALERGDWSIPYRVTTWIVPSEMPSPDYWQRRWRAGTPLLVPPPRGAQTLRFPGFPIAGCSLSGPQPLEDLKFAADADRDEALLQQERRLVFRIGRTGVLSGFSLHVTVECLPGQQLISSSEPGSHWANVFVPTTPAEAAEGDLVDMETKVDLIGASPTYLLRADLQRRGAACGQSCVQLLPWLEFQ